MKRILKSALSFLLVAVMVLGAAPLNGFVGLELPKFGGIDLPEFKGFDKIKTAVSDFFDGFIPKAEATTVYTDGYYKYTVDDNGNATLTGVDSSLGENIVVPSVLGGYTLVNIGSHAFESCDIIRSLTIPNSVTHIYDNAFSNCYCNNIIIPDSVVNIGSRAFSNMSGCENITVGENNQYYSSDDYGVLFNKLKTELIYYPSWNDRTTYAVPYSVTTIGDSAFYSCDSLVSVSFGNRVTHIGRYAFWNCDGLTSISIGNSITHIGYGAFDYCCSLKNIKIPNTVTIIDDYAFNCCESLTNITIPDSVTSIGVCAFYGCESLTNITLPDNVTSIGWEAFSLTGHYNSASNWENDVLYIGKHIIKAKETITGSYTIKDGTLTMASGCFAYCESLTSITIPNSITSISDNAFMDCSGLTSITIPDSITAIDDAAFYGCSGLASIIIPNNVTNIGESAFAFCEVLTSVTIGNGVKKIDGDAFYSCYDLIDVYYTGNIAGWCSIDFVSTDYVLAYNSSNPMKYAYNLYVGGKRLEGDLIIPEGITNIGNFAFLNCDGITSITLPSSIKTIGEDAFDYLFTDFYFSGDLSKWCAIEFANDNSNPISYADNVYIDGVKVEGSLVIPNNVTSINNFAFEYCYGLTSVIIPDGVTSIGDYAFFGCENLKNITISDSVVNIGDSAFFECLSLTAIIIGSDVTSIDDYAFYCCSELTEVFYTGTQEEWDSIAIGSENDDLTNATIHYNTVFVSDLTIDDNCKNLSLYAGQTKPINYLLLPENVNNSSIVCTSSDPSVAQVDSNGVVTAVSPGTAEIRLEAVRVVFGNEVYDTCTVTVLKTPRTISAPSVSDSTGVSCVLSPVPSPEGDGIIEYGWSLQNNSASVVNWQTSLEFEGLSSKNTYYFFARITGSNIYEDACSSALEIKLSDVPVSGSVSLTKNGNAVSTAFYGETLTAKISVEGEYTVCWYKNGEEIPGYSSLSYTLGENDIGSVISVAAKGNNLLGYTGSVSSNSVSIGKASVAAPSAPVIIEATENSITIASTPGTKYRLGSAAWRDAEDETLTFSGLYPNSQYKISAYIAESSTHNASVISAETELKTGSTYSLSSSYLDKQGVKYSLNSSAKTAGVTSSASTVSKSEIIIPQYVWKDGVQYKVTAVSANAFSGCSKIEKVTLSNMSATIGAKAFYGCSNLYAAYFDGTAPSSFGGNVFDSVSSKFFVYYYPTQNGWSSTIVAGKYNGYYALPRNAIEEIQRGSSDKLVYIVYVTDASGNVLPNANVTFNGATETTDASGYAFFEKPSVSSTSLSVSCKGYNRYTNDELIIAEGIALECVSLTDDPSVITSAICNKKDVITGTTQINRGLLLEKANITVKGYSQFDITKYEILQDNKVIASSKNGKFEILNSFFIENAQTIAVMHTSDGKIVQKVLNITVVNFWLDNIPAISLGEESSISIGDFSLNLELDTFPVQVAIDNEKLTLAVNLEVDDLSAKDKDLLKKGVREKLGKFSEVTCTGSIETTLCGYYIAHITEDGIKEEEAMFCVAVKVGLKAGRTFMVWIIPVRLDVSVSAEGRLEFYASYDPDIEKWKWSNLDLGLEAALALYAGIGTRYVSAGLFGSAKMNFLFQLLPKAYTKSIDLSGKFGLYAKAFNFRAEQILLQGTANLYPKKEEEKTSVASVAHQTFNLISAVYNEENYHMVDRDYLETRSGWLSAEETPEASTFSARALLANSVSSNSVSSNNNTLQTSVFSNIEPKIITCGETTMMIYADDNGGDDEYNNMQLVYSIYNESSDTWSVPVRVGGVDFNEGISDVYSDGKNIYIAYIQTNRMFTAADKMSDYAAASEIAVAKFDFENGTFEEPVVITDNDTEDMMPEFAVVDSVPCVVWINNKDNDSFAMTANNSLCYSRFKNGSWSEPVELISASPTITSSAIGTLGSKAYIAITRDIDCDLETNNDRYVSLVDFDGNVIDISTEGNNNEYINYITENGINKFIWLCDGNLMSITGADSEVTQISENPVPALSGGYQLVENNKGGFDILFTEVAGDGSEVYGMFYDEGWCSPVKVTRTEADRYVESYAATYIGDKLLIPYLSTAVTFVGDKMETTADLCCTTVEFKSDLKAESAEIDYENLMEDPEVSTFSLRRSAKTATVNLKVSNNGLSKVESVTVSIPELSFSQSQSVTIMPGEAKEISAVFNLPDDITADDLTVTVTPTGEDDIDNTDNSTSFKIGYTDFTVAAEQRILGNQDYILASVTNNGNLTGNAILKVVKDNLDGETLYELAIENLGIGETRYYMIETDSGFFDENSDCGLITVYAETDTPEEIDYNNYEFVVLNHFNREIADTENLVPNSSIGATSAVFDKYVPEDIVVEIDANGNTFEGITELSTDNYTVGENVTIPESYLSTLEVGSYDFTFVFRSSETQTQERVFTVVVEDSSPVAPEISGEQISVSVYDGNAIEEDIDFSVYTNSDGAVTFSFSSDNGATWTSGLPVLAGTYLIKADIAATAEYIASSTQFTVIISKAGRAISSPAAITVTNSRVSLTTVIPTVSESEDTVYYGYSNTDDSATVNNWSLYPVFDGLNANTEYYFFAKVSGGNNYADAISVATSVKTNKNSVDAPTAPVLLSKTDTTVTLVSIDGYEYRCNDGEWQSENVFEGLSPNQSYSFTTRIAETEDSYVSAPSMALVVTTDKSVAQAPAAPALDSKTDTTVTLTYVNGYEFRCNDGAWTDSNIFTGLDRNTEYSFYQRVAETDTSYASESSEVLTVTTDKTGLTGTVVIRGTAQTAETLTADVSSVNPSEAQFTYQWYSDGKAINGETSAEYTVKYGDIGHEITVELTGTNDFKGTLISAAVIPAAASANGTVSIEGEPVCGNELTATVTELSPSYAEYSLQWYRGNTPISGATNEKYTVAKEDIGQQITVKLAGINGYVISVSSAGIIPVKQTVAAPNAPKAETVTSDSITLVANENFEYRIGNGKWQSSNVFTADGNGNALMPDTEYAFSQRVKETETAYASAESEITVIRTKPIRVEGISISNSNVEMIKTYSYQLSASVSPDNATDKNIIWSSSDESVATVDQNGYVTAIESGNAVITAKSVDGGFTASCEITVVPDTYRVTWNVNGEKTTQEVRYSEYISVPQNPVADGYEFIGWTPEIPQTMPLYDLEFTAVFEPIEYYAEFVADGVTVSRVPYNVETDSINAPDVPDKTGYSGKWENYEFTIGGITVNAVYTVNNYKVTWIVDGEETQISVNYGESIDKSFVPQKDGYKFMGWTPDIPQTMPASDLTFTAVFEKSYICPDCGAEFLGENNINAHITAEARMKATVKIKNNNGSKTIKYGETLRLTAITTNMPTDARVYWYVDGIMQGEGETFNVRFESGTKTVEVKIVDSNGNVLKNSSGNEIFDSEEVTVKGGFFQKIISFFKNLFRINRTIIQSVFKGTF